MKIIYDTDQPKEKRIAFIGKDGKSYFGFHCFQIKLDDGKEVVELGLWGNEKKRQALLKEFNSKEGAEGSSTNKTPKPLRNWSRR
jgi:hypothetical protein